MKLSELNNIIENTLSEEIRKTIISEKEIGKKKIYHVKCEGEPVATFSNEEEALGYMKKVKDDVSGKPMIIEKEVYESYSDMIEKLDKMGEKLQEKENQNMKNKETMEGNPFAYAALMAKKEGKKEFKFGGKTHDVEEVYNQFDESLEVNEDKLEEEEKCNECGKKSIEEDFGEDPQTMGKIKSLYNKLHSNSQMEEELRGNQHRLDFDKDGDIESDDLKDLRAGKKGDTNEGFTMFMSAIISDYREKYGRDPSDEELGKEMKKIYGEPEKDEDKKDDKDKKNVKEGYGNCNECGKMLNEEGTCSECNSMIKESKKKTLRLTEIEMIKIIKNIINETVPGLVMAKKSSGRSGKESKEYLSTVEKKMKDFLSFDGNDNPEFPKQVGKGDKVARQNSEKEDEEVAKNFSGLQNLDYDIEPSENFKKRLKMAIEGDKMMGNGSKDVANVVASKVAMDKMEKQIKNRKKDKEERVIYKKEVLPVKNVNESKINLSGLLDEEINKMKKISSYNKKTQ